MGMIARAVAFAMVLLSTAAFGLAEVPQLTGVFNDPEHIVSAKKRDEITAFLKEQEAKTSNQVVVLVVKTLDGDTIENFADRVFGSWKLGVAGKDNGILVVLATKDGKARIEVGRGLQGVLPDVLANRILEQHAVPNFSKRKFGTGLLLTVQAIDAVIRGEYTPDAPKTSAHGVGGLGILFIFIVSIIAAAFFIFVVMAPRPQPLLEPVHPAPYRGRRGASLGGGTSSSRSRRPRRDDDDDTPLIIPVATSSYERSRDPDPEPASAPEPEPDYKGGGGEADGGGATVSFETDTSTDTGTDSPSGGD